ncbi:hypothetical protein ACFWMT_00985 [Streptomyces sp. NPDC058368]|uniref:hypothetical protein n=1 Tax=Streptomyces sp. NPDC058368 TaxID=3346461 RepID=UPI00364C2336
MSTPTPAEPTTDPAADPVEPDDVVTDTDPADDDTDPEGADALGDPGKKALDTMKGRLKVERDRRRALEAQLAERNKPADGDHPDQETLERQAEAKALARVNERLVKAEVRAAAAGKLADPADAHRFLDLSQFEVDDDGNIDADEVTEAIDDLLKSKPYLAAQGGSSKPRFQGTADSGARKGNARPTQLTEADVKRLSAAGNHAEIVKAQKEGRLDDYLGSNR